MKENTGNIQTKLILMKLKKILLIISAILFVTASLSAQNYKYIGADKCKLCHNKAATGEQYNKWFAGPHANALKSLTNEASLAYAKKNGIADPAKDAKCLECHSTFATIPGGANMGLKENEGVSCETCHGAGSAYKAATIMKSQETSIKNGLIVPDEDLCKKCHNPSNPFHKEFNYKTYSEKFAHPNPAAAK